MRRRYIWIDPKPGANYSGWVPVEDVQAEARLQIIRDERDPFLSHATGRVHDSKSAYRRELKDHGYVEMGNDKPTPQPYRPLPDWGQAIAEQLAGRGL